MNKQEIEKCVDCGDPVDECECVSVDSVLDEILKIKTKEELPFAMVGKASEE